MRKLQRLTKVSPAGVEPGLLRSVMHGVRLILLGYVLLAMAPGALVGDFLLRQERIARELCVQRFVPEAERTCHGHCQLMKRLRQLDTQDSSRAIQPPQLRFEQEFFEPYAEFPLAVPVPLDAENAVDRGEDMLAGHSRCTEPVPWC